VLILVRHGQTDANARGRRLGRADPPLNELGRAQAEQLAVDRQLRQLELAMRETYFHPSKVPANVMGDEGRAMPQQQ